MIEKTVPRFPVELFLLKLLLNIAAYGQKESTELRAEFGAAVHDYPAVLCGIEHIVGAEQCAERALE